MKLDEIDPAYVEEEAQRREIAWRNEAPVREADRRKVRARLSLGERLDDALRGLASVSTAPTASVQAPIAHGAPDTAPPPAADLPIASSRVALIAVHVETLERDLDVYLGRADPDELDWMNTDAKDAFILIHCAGIPSAQLADDFPKLGSARTIERVRRAAGVRPSSGLPR